MNPINDITHWPLIGDHPSWCNGFWCAHTDLGYLHRSDATRFTVEGDRWELTRLRADEPGPGETMISAVVTTIASEEDPVQHIYSLAGFDELIEALAQITEQVRAEDVAPVLEVIR